jgi:hypothetical protein
LQIERIFLVFLSSISNLQSPISNIDKGDWTLATYTTATLVRNRIENLDGSITDTMIEGYIEEAEQILNGIMGASFLSTFNATKHGILRAGCNAWAGMCAMTFNPAGFSSLAEANAMLEVLAYQWEQVIAYVRDKSVVEYLESL